MHASTWKVFRARDIQCPVAMNGILLPQADLDTGLSTRLLDGARDSLSRPMALTELMLLHLVAEAGWAKPWSWTACWHAPLLAGMLFLTCRRTLQWKQPSSCLNGPCLTGKAGCMEPTALNTVERPCLEEASFHSTEVARAGSCAVEAGWFLKTFLAIFFEQFRRDCSHQPPIGWVSGGCAFLCPDQLSAVKMSP